jgi:hypothetical protein
MTMPSAEEREARWRHVAAVLAHRRDIAQRINANEPAWDVMFGLGSRKFWAFPCWRGAPAGLIVSAADPSELLGRCAPSRRATPGRSRPRPRSLTADFRTPGVPESVEAAQLRP